MRIVFMGTPDFAVPSLQALIDNKYDIPGVFCQPDKPKGRGQKLVYQPVKEVAVKNNLQVFQPEKIKNGEALSVIKNLAPDLIVVVAYGKILPADILNLPELGCINVHASLLPKYRGAAPVQRAVINGEEETGVTIMQLDEGMDTGDMLAVEKIPLNSKTTSGELFEELSVKGAALLIKTIKMLEKGEITPEKQNNAKATYAPMLSKTEAEIDWSCPAEVIYNKIRGMNPWPVAFTLFKGMPIKIYSADVADTQGGKAGEVIESDKYLTVCCGDKRALRLTVLQKEGSRRMPADDFLRGFKIDTGTILGRI